jgi:hypothetical protein
VSFPGWSMARVPDANWHEFWRPCPGWAVLWVLLGWEKPIYCSYLLTFCSLTSNRIGGPVRIMEYHSSDPGRSDYVFCWVAALVMPRNSALSALIVFTLLLYLVLASQPSVLFSSDTMLYLVHYSVSSRPKTLVSATVKCRTLNYVFIWFHTMELGALRNHFSQQKKKDSILNIMIKHKVIIKKTN